MNIMILSAGTRVQLVRYFMDRANGFDKVVTTDCSSDSPAIYESDKYYLVPRYRDPEYSSTLIEICKKEKIDAVLPLQEDELLIINEYRDELRKHNVTVISSEKEVIELCRDKKAFYDYCVEKAIPCVPTYTVSEFRDSDLLAPVFVKPRFGAGSVNNFIANSREFVRAVDANYEDEFVVQPYLEGAQYAAEMYVDLLNGELIEYRVLKKLRMRGGESVKTIIVNSLCFEKLFRKICDSFQLKGVIDIDFIERDGEILVLEVNPRFGGVYPMVHENGGNFIKYLSNNLEGKVNEINNFDYRVGSRNYSYTQLMVKEGN